MGEVSPLLAPEPLADHHEFQDFRSGEASLDEWLKRRPHANQVSGASRTYVACEGSRVVGYYALASGIVTVENAPGRFRRNMPNPIPVAVLARLAVDRDWRPSWHHRVESSRGPQAVVAAHEAGLWGDVNMVEEPEQFELENQLHSLLRGELT